MTSSRRTPPSVVTTSSGPHTHTAGEIGAATDPHPHDSLTMSGALVVNGSATVPTPTTASHAATKSYVDLAVAPALGAIQFRKSAAGYIEMYNGSAWYLLPGQVLMRLYRTSATAITNNTTIPWDLHEGTKEAAFTHSTTTNPTRITCITAGTYRFDGWVSHQMLGESTVAVYLNLNGANAASTIVRGTQSPALGQVTPLPNRPLRMTPGDYVEIGVQNNVATNPNVAGSRLTIMSAFDPEGLPA